jgi:glutathione S-transferase
MLKLFIGNKNYSSWSMRPWVLLKQAGIPFEEVMVRFDAFSADSQFKQRLGPLSPAGKVPVLVDGDLVVWDTLAIAEYLAEQYPQHRLWPDATAARGACMMNIEASLPDIGALAWRDKPALRADVARIVEMWSELLAEHGGPMLFGAFSIADAYFAPVCMRLKTYALPVPGAISAYVERVGALPGVRAWTDGALAENDFIDFEEPFRLHR